MGDIQRENHTYWTKIINNTLKYLYIGKKYLIIMNLALDYKVVNKQRKKFTPMKLELRISPTKGVGIFATSKIENDEIVCLYRLQVFRIPTHTSTTDNSYCFAVYTVNGNESKIFIGDLVPESLEPPRKVGKVYIPFWGYFSNEPSPGQKSNVWVDMNLEENYKTRKRLKEGDYIVYKIVATRDIQLGDEIVWHYGSSYYGRDYKVGK